MFMFLSALFAAIAGLVVIAIYTAIGVALFGLFGGAAGIITTLYCILNPEIVGSKLNTLAWIWGIISVVMLFQGWSGVYIERKQRVLRQNTK